MNTLSVNNLLGIKNLQKEDINLIFKTADNFKDVINRPIRKVLYLLNHHNDALTSDFLFVVMYPTLHLP